MTWKHVIIMDAPGRKVNHRKTFPSLDIKLYGKEFHEDFKKVKSSLPHQEFDDYIEVIKHGSTFEGRHIRELSNEKSLPKHILMHVDLQLLISNLGYYAASENDQREIKSLSSFNTKKRRANSFAT